MTAETGEVFTDDSLLLRSFSRVEEEYALYFYTDKQVGEKHSESSFP